MNETMLFGNKENFAIELGLNSNIQKCKLCFWVQGKKMGSFTKGGELIYSIKAYNKFIASKEKYFLPIFQNMHPTKIREYFIDDMFSLGNSVKKEKLDEYKKREEFYLFFGTQFTNDGCFILLLYEETKVIFIFEPPKTLKADKFTVEFLDFCKVFETYIEYCNKNKLI